MLKRFVVFAIVAALAACSKSNSSSSPTSPSQADISGNWSGTIQYTQSTTTRVDDAVSMTVVQNGAAVSGTWQTTTGVSRNGTFSGTVTTDSFTGTFTYNSTATGGGACTGTMAMSGSIFSRNLIWSSPQVVENCTNPPTNVTFNVTK